MADEAIIVMADDCFGPPSSGMPAAVIGDVVMAHSRRCGPTRQAAAPPIRRVQSFYSANTRVNKCGHV